MYEVMVYDNLLSAVESSNTSNHYKCDYQLTGEYVDLSD